MRLYIANTDSDWFSYLRDRADLDEVNFWMPSDRRRFRVIRPGELFVFKLKARYRHAIVGFGVFERAVILPAWLAWDAFGRGNGAANFDEMNDRIARYRRAPRDPLGQYEIGCLIVSLPVWFAESDWIFPPEDWAPNIVQGKGYDATVGEGRRIYRECMDRALAQGRVLEPEAAVVGNDLGPIFPGAAGRAGDVGPAEESTGVPLGMARYGEPVLVRPRLGQGGFRIAVTEAYRRACAVTTEHSLPVLEAAHIKPYAESGQHHVMNGILLRADIHRLFDRGYVTVTPDHRFEVSRRLKDDFDNGRVYYEYQGKEIVLPSDPRDRPSMAALEWHNERVFVG